MASATSTAHEVNGLFREVTGQSVLLSQAIAERAGLSPADLEALGAVEQHGPVSAGQLGEMTGLKPASVTGLIDRLERAGVVARMPDPTDRRRVLVAISEGAAPIAALYDDLEARMLALLGRRNPRELATIAAFLNEAIQLGVSTLSELEGLRRAAR